MEIKTKQSFNDLLATLTEEILDEEDLEEVNTTASVGGEYMTPMAFDPEGEERKKKYKKDYKKVNEGIDQKDLVMIKKLVRSVIADVLRDIWIRRASWK